MTKTSIKQRLPDFSNQETSKMSATAGTPKIGVLGGSSFLESTYCKAMRQGTFDSFERAEGLNWPAAWESERPRVGLHFDDASPAGLVFCQRHEQTVPGVEKPVYHQPHVIDHVRNIVALKEQGCTHLVLFCSVGSLRADIAPGTIVIVDDFVSLSSGTQSRYTDKRSHIAPSLSNKLRESLINVVKDLLPDTPLLTTGSYVMTRGPRFETKAEIRGLAKLGEVVGMTAAHEITLACESPAIPVAAICCVDNYANGVTSDELSYESFRAAVAENVSKLERLLEHLGKTPLEF